LSKIDKVIEIYSSQPLEKVLFDTVKIESTIKESKEGVNRVKDEYRKNINKLK
jgi:hypothetical protein